MKEFECTRDNPVIKTTEGKIRGFISNGTYTFHGIKYADAKRFQSPTKVSNWAGVKDALSYGYVCPLLKQESLSNEVLIPHRFWINDENCLSLNLWTQSIDEKANRPVMVWLHGGGYESGSSIEQIAYDGNNLSQFGDVVVVSINHRLNLLGYLDLSAYGEKYKNSGNLGQEDIIAALKWIKENITNFGGNPNNVTLFGQSGGGLKIAALLQTPKANGLFHKAIIESGIIDDNSAPINNEGKLIVDKILKELGLKYNEIEKLEEVNYNILAKAYIKATDSVLQREGYCKHGYPKKNDFYLGEGRFVGYTDQAKTIPVIVGSNFGEMNFEQGINKKTATKTEIDKKLEDKFGNQYKQLKLYFEDAYPDKNIADLLELDQMFRAPTKDFVAKKSIIAK